MLEKVGGKGTLLHHWWKSKFCPTCMQNSMEVHLIKKKKKQLKIELPCDPTIPPLDIYVQRKPQLKK